MAKTTDKKVVAAADGDLTQAEEVLPDAKAEAQAEASVPKPDDGYEDILVPKNYLTGPEDEHVPVVLNGKIYQVKLGETVRVPKGVAGILKNAMAQKSSVTKLIKNRAAAPKALN